MKKKAYAKINIFLKIIGTKEDYHLISSRFVLLKDLYDDIEFIKKEKSSNFFELEGDFGCSLEKNTIYKAYNALLENSDQKKIKDFFQNHKVYVKKRIPEFAGLAGGSSDAASFMMLLNSVLDLNLSKKALSEISSKIGSDLPFFIYGYKSANVGKTGESVEKFEESLPKFSTFTPDIKCDTAKVYQEFRKNHISKIEKNQKLAQKLRFMKSEDILKEFDAKSLNDLLDPALTLYGDLKKHQKEGWFFSGSGSTFFKMENR